MDEDHNLKAKELADKLTNIPEQEWDGLLDEWCDGDESLREKVLELIKKNKNARLFVEEFQRKIYSLTKSSITSDQQENEQIDDYEIIKKLGEGGSATVYLARHANGEYVALKLLRGIGFDSNSRHRFESEQRILASLDHPNIAWLIDGGITRQGTPYVIMEYVDGVPLDEWSDKKRLNLQERIRLFQDVCKAVHYAHQNLVVHRDLKPEHVLVTEKGEIKLIDFGIAKLLEPELEGANVFQTRTGMRIMTPEFASPEQVQGIQISTVSDVYSLGVLLYLLLAGRKPYQIQTMSMLEIEKIVCETEPPKPSEAALSESRNGYDSVQISKQLSGDLDRIILMAMWKEPHRRYPSALSLAEDLENFLNGEPISARAPTLRYRVKKFIYRNKVAAATAAIAFVALLVGVAGVLWQAHQATLNAERAEIHAQQAEQIAEFLVQLFEESDPTKANDGSKTAREMLDEGFEKVQTELEGQTAVQAQMLGMIGKVYQNLGLYEQALPALEMSVEGFRSIQEQSPQYVSALLELANLEYRMGMLDRAQSSTQEVLELNMEFYGPNHPEVASTLNTLAIIYEGRGNMEEAKNMLRRVVEIRRKDPEPGSNLAANLNNLAILMHRTGELEGAGELFEEAIEVIREIWGDVHPYMAFTLNGYSGVHQGLGNYDRAMGDLLKALEIGQQVFHANHPFIGVVYHNLGKVFEELGDYAEALQQFENGLQLRRRSLPPTHSDLATSLDGVGSMYIELGKAAEAETMLREALDIRKQAFEETDWRIAQSEARLGRCLIQLGRLQEAEPLLAKSYETLLSTRGEDDIHTITAFADLNFLRQESGKQALSAE